MSARSEERSGIVVIGLGRFGSHLAGSLVRQKNQVLAIDRDAAPVQRWSAQLDRVVQADATQEGVLQQLGVADIERAVVAIGDSVEASVLTVLALVEMGVPQIWARATSSRHAKILSSVGSHHVIFPEREAGERVAHLIVSKMLDFIEFGDDFAIAKVLAPQSMTGRPLAELRPADRYGVRVVGVRLPNEEFRYATDDTVAVPGSMLIVEGSIDKVQQFAALS
ncbi:TrkA family potassium uptake protein [Micromonospora sp. NPDC126480]|uniref:potassium channel family protein n=1 Tax=Micromonospora sp. NPDC126480 TaxID=3155312 RepID=UPI003321207C